MLKLPFSTSVSTFTGDIDPRATINYGCDVPIRIGSHIETVPCLVTWLNPKLPLALGMQWFRKNKPAMVTELLKLGGGELSSPEISEPIIAASNNGHCYPVVSASRSSVLLAAISAEENSRTELQEKFRQTIALRSMVTLVLDSKDSPADETVPNSSASAISVNTRSVNGLTKNSDGWEELIPSKYQRFVNTVFSDKSARIFPPHRPGFDAEVTLKEGEKMWQSKLYDMPKDQLAMSPLHILS